MFLSVSSFIRSNYLIAIMGFNILFFNSCTKKLDYDFIEQPQKLVVNSILTPDSLLKVHVSITRNILKADTVIIDNALVLLYQNNVFYDTLLDKGKGLYMATNNLYPCIRCVYKVIVKAPGFPDAEAEDKIPDLNISYDVHVTYPYGYDQNNEPISLFDLTFKDPAGEKNYYELMIYKKEFGNNNKYSYLTWSDIKTDDKILKDEGDMDYYQNAGGILISDNLFNGNSISIKFKIYGVNFDTSGNSTLPVKYVVLRSVSEPYYKYKKYLLRHLYNQNNSNSIDDPLHLLFSSEPTNMYTNINNGYGIFAGYSGVMKQVRLN